MSGCLNVRISANERIKACATIPKERIKAGVTILQKEVLNASVTSLVPLEVRVEGRNKPLRFLIQSTAPHIKVNGSNVCGVDFSWDSIFDYDGIALFDADNERLLINIK